MCKRNLVYRTLKVTVSLLSVLLLITLSLEYNPGTRAAPEPEEIAFSATQHRETISAGSDHPCGLKGNGTLICWGLNNSGQATPPEEEFGKGVPEGIGNVDELLPIAWHALLRHRFLHCCSKMNSNLLFTVCWGKSEGFGWLPG